MRGKTCAVIIAFIAMAIGSMAHGGEAALKVADAWVPTAEKIGVDVPLSLTIQNESGTDDALLRVRCPVANFSERHIVDRGEGAPAMRSVRSIPIAASTATVLKAASGSPAVGAQRASGTWGASGAAGASGSHGHRRKAASSSDGAQ